MIFLSGIYTQSQGCECELEKVTLYESVRMQTSAVDLLMSSEMLPIYFCLSKVHITIEVFEELKELKNLGHIII